MRRKLEGEYRRRLDEYLQEYITAKKRGALEFLIEQFEKEVADETELALMRGEARHLGEKHMLLSCVYSAISMTSRPIQRETSYRIFKQALDKYLGIQLKAPSRKRKRRKLLPHV